MSSMRILVACEESQAVTLALRKRGHLAFSCDILPCSGGHPEWHIQDDVFNVIGRRKWDMMIAFPPCTHLACSGARHFKEKQRDGRQQEAIRFFMRLMNAPVPRIAIENPIGIMSTVYRKPDQIIQPYQFGNQAQKSTCLWLKDLPLLTPTRFVSKGPFVKFHSKSGTVKRQSKWYYDALRKAKSAEERRTLRSKTFPGIAQAMAQQWSELVRS